jgi:hypothetical protein
MYGACLGLPLDYLAKKPKRLKYAICAIVAIYIGFVIIGPMAYDTMVLNQPWQPAFILPNGKPAEFANGPTAIQLVDQQKIASGARIPKHVVVGQILPQWVAVLGQQSGKSASPLVMTAGIWFPGKVVKVHAPPEWTVGWYNLFQRILWYLSPQNDENWVRNRLAAAGYYALNAAWNELAKIGGWLAAAGHSVINETRNESFKRVTL